MRTLKISALLVSTSILFAAALTAPVFAQNNADVASGTKAASKASRKADRKIARSRKNKELKTLETSGYAPTGQQTDYPQNLQNAEKKGGASKSASAP